jgi:Glycosyl transferase family 64 domain
MLRAGAVHPLGGASGNAGAAEQEERASLFGGERRGSVTEAGEVSALGEGRGKSAEEMGGAAAPRLRRAASDRDGPGAGAGEGSGGGEAREGGSAERERALPWTQSLRQFWRVRWWQVGLFSVTVFLSILITGMVSRTIYLPLFFDRHEAGLAEARAWEGTVVSVVLMSYKRPEEVRLIVKHYTSLPIVGEVLIFNNNGEEFDLSDLEKEYPTKVHVLSSSANLGVHSRFATGTLARHNPVLFQDDDLVLSPPAISKLVSGYNAAPMSIHGVWGRFPTREAPYAPGGGVIPPSYTRAPIVLTRAFVVDKLHMGTFWVAAPHLDYLAAGAVPRWNGEDILFSLAVLAANNGTLHYTYPELAGEVSALTEAYAISGNWGVHGPYRTVFTEACFQILGIEFPQTTADYAAFQDGTPLKVEGGIDVTPPIKSMPLLDT